MERVVNLIERLFYTKIIGNVDLYTIFASLFKYAFVIIVMYFIYLIVRMIYLDIEQVEYGKELGSYLHLITPKKRLPFEVQSEYVLHDVSTIGRDSSNTISIKYPYLSGRHATIFRKEDVYYLEDEASANGTLLNGQAIKGIVPLKNKDIISFVDLEFLVMLGDS